ncbi:MAG: PIN domain-containing protein [Candidatus Aminicenantes bacterium]
MNENKVFLDTNILIYAYDASAGQKNLKAKEILVKLWNSKRGIISIQVMQEFFVNVTSKIQYPIDTDSAEVIIKDLFQWEVVVNDEASVLKAIDIHIEHKFSFWDAMILQAAVHGRAKLLYTEDMTHGQEVQGVRIVNPFIREN